MTQQERNWEQAKESTPSLSDCIGPHEFIKKTTWESYREADDLRYKIAHKKNPTENDYNKYYEKVETALDGFKYLALRGDTRAAIEVFTIYNYWLRDREAAMKWAPLTNNPNTRWMLISPEQDRSQDD